VVRIGIRHNLVVIAMHHQDRHGDLFQVFGKVGLRECDDAVIVRFGASHHTLAPPIPDHPLRGLCTRPVVTIERSSLDILIEPGSVSGEMMFMSERDAIAQGYRAARNGQCTRFGTGENEEGMWELSLEAREGAQSDAPHLRQLEPLRRHATLVVILLETAATLTDEILDCTTA
jgi:hypothetical protein